MTDEHVESETHRRVTEIATGLTHLEGPLLPILHAVQHEFGCVPEDAIRAIATVLNLGRAEVHGTLTFYPDYRSEPGGAHTLKLCRAEACQSLGGDALADEARRILGIDFHETTTDGALTLEPVYCLGLCACAPAAMLDHEVHGRVTPDTISRLAAGVGA
jgi:formate dehydrogenase subunit gamma